MASWRIDHYRQVFQHRSFRTFWLGFSFSVLGDTMTRVALTWFVYETTRSAEALGLLNLFYIGPVIVGGFVAGWLLDRFDRRKVMLIDNLLRGLAVSIIPILHFTGQLALWHVYLVAAIYGLLMMVSLAGGPSLMPALVDEEQLATANALETLSYTLGGVIGPAIAGVLIAQIDAPNVVIIDAISYFVFAFALLLIHPIAEDLEQIQTRKSSYRFSDATQLLLKNKVLLSTTLMFMIFNFGFSFASVWLPIFTDQNLHGGPELYGTLLGFLAIGEVLSSIAAGGLTSSLKLGRMICLTQFLSGLALALIFLFPSVIATLISLILFGIFSAPLTIWAQTLRMQIIPEALRGRTFALLRTLMQGAGPLGGVLAGALLPIAGMSAMIGLSAIVVGSPGLIGYLVKDLRQA